MIYFSHSITDFNTPKEKIYEKYIADFFSEQVENPNKEIHQIGYTKNGMDYYVELIKDMDFCVFMRMENGKIGAGVAKEVNTFLLNNKPVYELDRNSLDINEVSELNKADVLSVEETRKEIKAILRKRN